jgi:hypothetical protein
VWTRPKERLAAAERMSDPDAMPELGWNPDDTKLLFEVLFDMKTLLAEIVDLLEGGDDDGEAEEADE